MSESILIKGGQVFDPSQKIDAKKDLLIEKGKIGSIAEPGEIQDARAEKVIDLDGQWVLPGFIDVHVHFRDPGLKHKETIETGTRAAVAGGFTQVACMANTQPVNDSKLVTEYIVEQSQKNAHCQVHPIGAVTKGLKGQELAQIGAMVDAGAVAISDDGMPVMNSFLMRKAMEYAKTLGIPVISHAEDAHLVAGGVMNEGDVSFQLGLSGNPAAAEEIMVAREIALARLTGCRVHIAHLSTQLALEHVKRAKEEGLPVSCEVAPHHLFLTDQAVLGYETHCKMAPPLRTEADILALQEGLKTGLVDFIATDHAPHAPSEKDQTFNEAPFGVIGLQTAVSLSFDLVKKEALSKSRWIESLSSAPAQFIGVEGGTLKEGVSADVVIFDPSGEWEYTRENNASKSENSPFMQQKLFGKIEKTIVAGKIQYAQ